MLAHVPRAQWRCSAFVGITTPKSAMVARSLHEASGHYAADAGSRGCDAEKRGEAEEDERGRDGQDEVEVGEEAERVQDDDRERGERQGDERR